MLDKLAGRGWYYFLDGYSCYKMISVALEDEEKMTFIFTYGNLAFKHMSFGLCNAPTTFQRFTMSFFSDMVEDTHEVFMDDFFVVGDILDECLMNLSRALQ